MGFLPHKIRLLSQQLQDLEAQPVSEEIEEKLISVRATIQEMQKQEEEIWKSKSCIQWLTTTDMNTKFFHLSTVIRRRRNDIILLQDSTGLWHSDRLEVGNLLADHFKSRYHTSNLILSSNIAKVLSLLVSDIENFSLCKQPDER